MNSPNDRQSEIAANASGAPGGEGDPAGIDRSTEPSAREGLAGSVQEQPSGLADFHSQLARRLDSMNTLLKEKEQLKLTTLSDHVHDAYYRSWVREANACFRVLSRWKKRQSRAPT